MPFRVYSETYFSCKIRNKSFRIYSVPFCYDCHGATILWGLVQTAANIFMTVKCLRVHHDREGVFCSFKGPINPCKRVIKNLDIYARYKRFFTTLLICLIFSLTHKLTNTPYASRMVGNKGCFSEAYVIRKSTRNLFSIYFNSCSRNFSLMPFHSSFQKFVPVPANLPLSDR